MTKRATTLFCFLAVLVGHWACAPSSGGSRGVGAIGDGEEHEGSRGLVTVTGPRLDGVNPLSGSMAFDLAGASFSGDAEGVRLRINGESISVTSLAPQRIESSYQFEDGRNEVSLVVPDTDGRAIELDAIFWAGFRRLDVDVERENGSPVSGAEVTLTLVDDPDVVLQGTTTNGIASFFDMPGRTFLVTARDSQGRFGSTGAVGDQGFVAVTLWSFDPPSLIDNNDLHLGTTEGWDVGSAPVDIVPHDEGDPGFAPDWDLKVTTAGEGPQTISRTFQTQAGVKNVSVRYRFITSEVPGGYFGSKYNDTFSVSIRAEGSAAAVSESNSMNSLGLAAFDAKGATAWRTKSLAVPATGDVVQVDVTVANVGDGLFDSSVVVDWVEEKALGITAFELHDVDGQPLRYLSTGSHPYFGGQTRVHGKLTVEGAKTDQLSTAKLEVIQGGKVVATASLSSAAASLLQPFGDDEKVEIASSQLLFELPSAQAALVDGSADGTLQLRVSAESASGQTVSQEFARPLGILVRYRGTGRYGPRNEHEGGDDWGQPSVVKLLGKISQIDQVGDLSNMNGGHIAPHTTHREGRDIDAWFNGYNARNTGTAVNLLELLNGPNGKHVELIYVTYRKQASDDFWSTIQSVKLDDDRYARDVILPFAGHESHFHLRLK